MDEISLKQRVASSVFWLAVTKTTGQVISWGLTIYIVRILSPKDFGLMGMTMVFIGFMKLFNELGLGPAIIQKKRLAENELSYMFWAILCINIFLTLASFLLAPFIADLFRETRLITVIRVISSTFIISGLGLISFNILTREISFNKRAGAELIGNLTGCISTLLFAINGFGVWSLVYGEIIVAVTSNFFYYIFYPYKPRLAFSFEKIRGSINFGLNIAAARLFWYMASRADAFIAGRLLGSIPLGYYSLALQFASLPNDKIVSLFTQVAFPVFSKMQDDHELLKKAFLRIVGLIALLTLPLFLGIFLVAEDAVYLLLTEKWSPSIIPLKILSIISCLKAVEALNAPLIMAKGRGKLIMVYNLVLAIVLCAGFYIGCSYGLEGLAFSWLLVFPILFVVFTRISLKMIDASFVEYFMELKHALIGTALMMVFALLLQNTVLQGENRIFRISATCVIGMLVYLPYQFKFNRRSLEELIGIMKGMKT